MKTAKTKKQILNGIIAILFLAIACLFYLSTKSYIQWAGMICSICMVIVHFGCFLSNKQGLGWKKNAEEILHSVIPKSALTEVVLLGDDNNRITSWSIYGKTGMVIGRDVGENDVNINLEGSSYASTIDVEHAVLNYSGDCWYIEDISEKNGVSIQKQDGKKYKLSYGKPCKLERGDIMYIALAKLQIL